MSTTATTWTKEQLDLAKELTTEYGIDPAQISFDAKTGQLILEFEALQAMAHTLCPGMVTDQIEIHKNDAEAGYHICNAILDLANGKRVIRPGVAIIGEELGDGEAVLRLPQAISLASARAYRSALRAIGFDPLRAHRQRTTGQQPTLEDGTERADALRRELHAVATELGLINGKDKTAYREMMRVMYDGRTSSLDLDDEEARQFTAYLRARLNARERATYRKAA
ncbi:MAG: hypothetical protein AB7U82_34850 [Blastocatellales bacterium]